MKKVVLSILFIALLAFQSIAFAESREVQNLPLNEREKVQLEYESLYLDAILDITTKYFGDFEGFNEFGEIYINNDKDFHFVIAISEENDQITSFINEIKTVVPEYLLLIQKVKYSKNALIAIQNDILNRTREGHYGLSKSNVEISSSVKDQKVILLVDQTPTTLSFFSAFPEYEGLLELQIGNVNEPAKARDDAFTEMGGGLKVSLSCSTTATATKDTREFLITAGHCIKNIGATVSQGGTNIGKEHYTVYGDGGTDVGLILLTNTSKKIGNQYYYGDVANAEYDKRYTTTAAVLTGQLICKSGYKSGVTCGTVNDTSSSVSYGSITLSNMIKVYKDGGGFILGGDSGGTVFNAYTTTHLVGIVSGRNTSGTPEGTWGYVTKIGPALTAAGSVTLYTSNTTKVVNPDQ